MKQNAGRQSPALLQGIEGQVANAPKSLQTEIRWKRSPSSGDDHGLTTIELNAMSRFTTICFILLQI